MTETQLLREKERLEGFNEGLIQAIARINHVRQDYLARIQQIEIDLMQYRRRETDD